MNIVLISLFLNKQEKKGHVFMWVVPKLQIINLMDREIQKTGDHFCDNETKLWLK